MTIAFINAMQKEHDQLARLLQGADELADDAFCFVQGTCNGCQVVLMASGIGKVNAAVGAAALIRRFRPAAIVNTGVAGGMGSKVKVMDVVAGERVAYHDVDCGPESQAGQVQGMPRYFEADARLLRTAMSLRTDTTLHSGLICSGDRFVTGSAQIEAIKSLYPDALAVDMESAAIAQTCHLYRTPFLSFRVISDTPESQDHFGQYLHFWDTIAERSFAVTRELLRTLTEPAL